MAARKLLMFFNFLVKQKPAPKSDITSEELMDLIRLKAENYFATRQLWCSQAVFVTLSQGFGTDIPPGLAAKMAAAFGEGMGGAGCSCGALTGGVLAMGLFLGSEKPGFSHQKASHKASQGLHDQFKATFGSTCCRVLSRKVKNDPKAHFKQCTGFTGQGAQMAARILLQARPELIQKANPDFLARADTRAGAVANRFFGFSDK